MGLEKAISDGWGKISKQCKYAFFASAIVGLLDYLYIITNHFLTFDSMWNQYSLQNMIDSGRQFLTYACSISSYYDLPAVNGILAIIYLSITAAMVVYVMEIRSVVSSVLIGGLIVSFPAVSSTFCYTYTVDGYMLSLLLITLAFLIMQKYRFGWIVASVLIGVSLGIYQAYYSFIIILCILKLLLYLIYEKDLKKIFSKVLNYVSAGILGYLLYIVSLKLMLTVQKVSLSGYQGSNKVLGFDLRTIPMNVYKATRNFFSFIFSMNVLTATKAMSISLGIIVMLGCAGYVYLLIKNRIYKNAVRVIMILLLVAITPAAATLVMVMSPDSYFHVLMRMPWSLFFAFVLCIAERVCEENDSSKKWKQNGKQLLCAAISLSCGVMIFQFVVMQGIVAYNMNEKYEKTYSFCSRIIDRLEQQEEYQYGDKVAVIGEARDTNNYPSTSITDRYVGWYFGVNGELCVASNEDFEVFCSHFLGTPYVTANENEIKEIVGKAEFAEMDNFPKATSVKKIGDVWVIKLNG